MTRWPWITGVLTLIVALNQLGLDMLRSAFMSNEALSRNIARPLVMMTAGVLLAVGIVEWIVRLVLRNRRMAAAARHAAAGPNGE